MIQNVKIKNRLSYRIRKLFFEIKNVFKMPSFSFSESMIPEERIKRIILPERTILFT